jgi:VanZ family protein
MLTFWRLLSLAYVLVLCTALFGPFGGAEKSIGVTDKLMHAAAFGATFLCASLCFPRRPLYLVAIAVSLFGGLTEIIQGMTGRDADLLDWVADSIGVALAWSTMFIAQIRQRLGSEG